MPGMDTTTLAPAGRIGNGNVRFYGWVQELEAFVTDLNMAAER